METGCTLARLQRGVKKDIYQDENVVDYYFMEINAEHIDTRPSISACLPLSRPPAAPEPNIPSNLRCGRCFLFAVIVFFPVFMSLSSP